MLGKVAVIGLGRFGRALSRALAMQRWPVLAIDHNMVYIEQVSGIVDRAVCIDATDEDALASVGIQEMSAAVVAVGTHSVETSILATALLKQLGVPRIIARATTTLHARILRVVGAHEVINPEQEAADRLARRVIQPGIIDFRALSNDLVLSEIAVPASFVGKTILDLDVRRRYNVSILATQKSAPLEPESPGIEMYLPNPKLPFKDDDILLVLGSSEDVARMSQLD